jgi:hypothetical protein
MKPDFSSHDAMHQVIPGHVLEVFQEKSMGAVFDCGKQLLRSSVKLDEVAV